MNTAISSPKARRHRSNVKRQEEVSPGQIEKRTIQSDERGRFRAVKHTFPLTDDQLLRVSSVAFPLRWMRTWVVNNYGTEAAPAADHHHQ